MNEESGEIQSLTPENNNRLVCELLHRIDGWGF
ncbi:hypothetical protein PCC8801_3487 [Rippkaea orientalis PCC 8801]|uniref:Uncharacterized protein n=1 Tax=Rippkaea orientalis (strain PCC 8801 / RF-1) TaxID=41431 RepID=B7K0G8_RIPO1|nr:hypothetical protein PCC8801_3487 [Rippkaea orientalis PCC 8801]